MSLIWMCFLLVILVKNAISLKFVFHPDADLNIVQRIQKCGYPVEVHKVTTEDNYIISMHRIPYGRSGKNNGTKRSPVVLAHGMGAQSDYYVVLGRDNALPFHLADQGFDVWLLSFRGTKNAQKHKYYDSITDYRYWKFSIHELGVYDLPAQIDYIVNATNQKVFFIGHSQGNTCYFIMTSERPEYNEKVKVAAVYGISTSLKYLDYPFANFLSYPVAEYQIICKLFKIYAIPFLREVLLLSKVLCAEITYARQFCEIALSVIGSHKSKLISNETVSLIFSIPLGEPSIMQLFHYMQLVKSGLFRRYDFGPTENLRKYNSSSPAEYDLKQSNASLVIFYAERDSFATLEGIKEAINILPNIIRVHKIPYKDFNHIDYLFGSTALSLVYEPTSQLFKDFDVGNLQLNTSRKTQFD